jgi:calcineurin-like phosphoesterase family protein
MTSDRLLRPITKADRIDVDSEDDFTFVVMGDGRPTLPRMPYPRVAQQAMRELRLLRPAFVLYTGDGIWGYQDTAQELENELDRFRALCDVAGVPVFCSPGNHEMQTDTGAIDLLVRKGHSLYGSFDVGRNHIVALNTDEHWKEGRVCGEQLDWLRADLAANADAERIFVFMHRPLSSEFQGDFNPDDRAVLEELFASHPVRAVYASHDHLYSESERDGVLYVTAGGAGSPLYAQPQAGGFSHYVLVRAGQAGVEHTVVQPFHLTVDQVAGGDGIYREMTVRVSNTTDRDVRCRNLELRLPRLAAREGYRLRTRGRDWERRPIELPVALREVEDCGDGSVLLHVEVDVPTGTSFYVTAEAREGKRASRSAS